MIKFKLSATLLIVSSVTVLIGCGISKKVSKHNYPKTKQNAIETIMANVAKWQIDSIKKNGWRHSEGNWTNGALYTGLIAYADAMNDDGVYKFLKKNVGDKLSYQLLTDSNRYHADYYCVGQLYTDLYAKYKDPKCWLICNA